MAKVEKGTFSCNFFGYFFFGSLVFGSFQTSVDATGSTLMLCI